VHEGCRRCTESIKMQNREEMVLLLSVIHVGRSMQVCTEEAWCIEWKEDTEHKAQKKQGT
jgi:hypothetical protein